MRRHTFCNDRPLFFGNSVPEHFLDGCSHEKLSFKTCFIDHLGINSTIFFKKKKEFYWVSPAIFRNSFSIIFRPVSRCWGVFQRGNGSGRLEHGGTRAPARHQVRAFFFPQQHWKQWEIPFKWMLSKSSSTDIDGQFEVIPHDDHRRVTCLDYRSIEGTRIVQEVQSKSKEWDDNQHPLGLPMSFESSRFGFRNEIVAKQHIIASTF